MTIQLPSYIEARLDEYLIDAGYQGTITSLEELIAAEENKTDDDNFKSYLLSLESSFEYQGETFKDGTLVYWYFGQWNQLNNVDNDEKSFVYTKKYLSTLTSRFFSSDLATNYPKFVQFCKEWLVQCDEGFWRIASKLDSVGDVDQIPEELLHTFLSQYAIYFGREASKIPYFYDESTGEWNYKHIRHFLRLSRQFALSKGSPNSVFFVFKMFDGKLLVRFPYKQLQVLSSTGNLVFDENYNIVTEYNPITDRMEPSYVNESYISCREGDSEQSLYRLHGTDDKTGVIWGYYTLLLYTDLDIDKYREIIEKLVRPAGVKYFWDILPNEGVEGVQDENPLFLIVPNDTTKNVTILDIELPENYEGMLVGRDTEYSSVISTFTLLPQQTKTLALRYVGDESEWQSETITLWKTGSVKYMSFEIGA